jgi:aspartate dehydrogenase
MLDDVDLVLECASPDSVKNFAPLILKQGCDMLIMSIGAFMDKQFYTQVLNIAKENNAKIHLPSGAIVGLDGIKAVAKFGLKEVTLVTRKSPKSLGKNIDAEEVLFEGKASEAVKEVSRSKVEIICNVMEDKTMEDKIIVTLLASKFGNYMD